MKIWRTSSRTLCKEFGIDVMAEDIEGCHQSPPSRNSRGHDIILKFVNRKHSESLLKDKNESVVRTSCICMFLIKFLYLSPFAHNKDISGGGVGIFKGKGRYIMFFVWRALSA